MDFASAVAAGAGGTSVVVGSHGVGTVFVARYDGSGGLVWTTDLDGPWPRSLNGVALDAAGDAYVVGSSPVDAVGFHRTGFLAKLDRAGAVQ